MDHAVEREIEVAASRDEAWDALTSPKRLAEWLGMDVELDLEAGGEAIFHAADGRERRGFVEEVTPPERLVFWWGDQGADPTRVELELEEADARTRVRVTESRPFTRLDLYGVDAIPIGRPESGGPQLSVPLAATLA